MSQDNLDDILNEIGKEDQSSYNRKSVNKAKKPSTMSQQLRYALYNLWLRKGSKGIFEDFYKQMAQKFIEYVNKL